MREGARVELMYAEGVLVKSKRKPKPRYRLSALLAGITAHNVHPETNLGPFGGQRDCRSLDWRTRHSELICKAPAEVVDQVTAKLQAVLGDEG